MKLLWHSNAPWSPTGYGTQTALFLPLVAEHYDVACSAFYGLEAARIVWDGIPIYPGLGGDYGREYLVKHAQRHFGGDARNGIVFTLMDVWVLDNLLGGQVNLVSWTPVDHEPVPPAVQGFFVSGAVPLAMSRFGEKQLQDLDPLYCPHAVDTSVYRPYDRREVRKEVGLPQDAFLVGMVAANKGRPSRKGFQQALQAFSVFAQQHPEALFYLHTMIDPNVAGGENLQGLIGSLGIDQSRILTSDQYRMVFDPMSSEQMAKAYSAMDVLMNPAMGEGFGIPVLEAQACGVPVIVTDFSAMPEVAGAGWHVKSDAWWSPQNSWQAIADVGDIVDALRQCYGLSHSGRKTLSEKARKHALKYDVKRVFDEHMLPSLKTAEERFEERRPVELVRELKAAA